MAAERSFVLDTSALLALRGDEPGADRVHALLAQASKKRCRVLISFMSRMELFYCIWREEGENAAREALRLLDSFAIDWITCEPGILDRAPHIQTGARISLAASWIGATASASRATFV